MDLRETLKLLNPRPDTRAEADDNRELILQAMDRLPPASEEYRQLDSLQATYRHSLEQQYKSALQDKYNLLRARAAPGR